MQDIPAVVTGFNVYRAGDKLVGVSGEVTLPDVEYATATLSGAGIGGEIDVPVKGQFPAMTMEIPFAVLYDDSFSIMQLNGEQLTLRGNIEEFDSSTGALVDKAMRIIVGGLPKGIKLGKMGQGSAMDGSNGLEITYLKIEIGGAEKLEVDKLNYVFRVNGQDMLATARNNM
jgi:phage tail tube protein FII